MTKTSEKDEPLESSPVEKTTEAPESSAPEREKVWRCRGCGSVDGEFITMPEVKKYINELEKQIADIKKGVEIPEEIPPAETPGDEGLIEKMFSFFSPL
jgi:hypothetical protein